jgi:hypothetical protein
MERARSRVHHFIAPALDHPKPLADTDRTELHHRLLPTTALGSGNPQFRCGLLVTKAARQPLAVPKRSSGKCQTALRPSHAPLGESRYSAPRTGSGTINAMTQSEVPRSRSPRMADGFGPGHFRLGRLNEAASVWGRRGPLLEFESIFHWK